MSQLTLHVPTKESPVMASGLSRSQCILLTVNLASEAQIQPLHGLYLQRGPQVLQPELILRILLTYLPEATPSDQYTPLIESLISNHVDAHEGLSGVNVSSVHGISPAAADKRLRKLTLLPLSPPNWPDDAPDDILTRFLCHRAYRIDQETGLVRQLPDLLRPFLDRSDYLRLWFISVVLPLLRLQHEWRSEADATSRMSLEAFERIDARQGTQLLLPGIEEDGYVTSPAERGSSISHGLRGLVGPWLYGHTARKRRKLNNDDGHDKSATEKTIAVQRVPDESTHSWSHVNTWLITRAAQDFPAVTAAIDDWDGPIDVDLGGFASAANLMEDDVRSELERRYAQAALATCYVVEDSTEESIHGAHGILVRLAGLLDFEPPPGLATSVEQLPTIDHYVKDFESKHPRAVFEPDQLLDEKNPFTAPTDAPYMLLQMLVYSAYQTAQLGYPLSILSVAKLRLFADEDEQLSVLQRILHGLCQHGKRDESQWLADKSRLMWLWNWNIEPEEPAQHGSGPFGHILRDVLEREILVAMLNTTNYSLVDKLYVHGPDRRHRLRDGEMQTIILTEALRSYDNASNGNRQRGLMKKADDIICFFLRLFPESGSFKRAFALMQATHSLSFYSLTLQHNVPFRPVNVRTSPEPISLLEQVLAQNPKSYAKLDDLISIGRNLALAAPHEPFESTSAVSVDERAATQAERRVIYMCISSALSNSDFDTAYSYLTTRLQPKFTLPSNPADQEMPATSRAPTATEEDDISWRAAYLAGRTTSTTNANPSLQNQIHRLNQRTELLSLALLLAPASALTEILNVYRRVEEETTALITQRDAQEAEHDALLDRQRAGQPPAAGGSRDLPGAFGSGDVFEGRTYGQTSRSSGAGVGGRGASRTEDEAPVGLFDLARGAASALSRGAFPLRTNTEGPLPGGQRNAAAVKPSSSSKAEATGAPGIKTSIAAKSPPPPPPPPPAATGQDEADDWAAWDEPPSSAPVTSPAALKTVDRGDDQGHDDDDDDDDDDAEEAWGWNAEQDDDAKPDTATGGGRSGGGGGAGGGTWGIGSLLSTSGEKEEEAGGGTVGTDGGDRVRKRDVLADAATRGLASGIGWVLGATPVEDRRPPPPPQQQQ